MTSAVDIRPDHLEIVQGILREHLPVGVKVWVFGSRADWTTKDSSDLDLALEGKGRLDHRLLATLKDAFQDSALPYTVDIVDLNRISDSFRLIVESQRTPLALDGNGAKQGVNWTDSDVSDGSSPRPTSAQWREVTLGDVITLQRGFDLPKAERQPGPHPVIASTGPVGTHREAAVKGPGVVIGRSGSLGGGQFIESDFWPLNTTLWAKDFHGNDERFCYYLLKSLNLADFNAGSGVPTLNRNHIHPLPVKVPDVPEQRAIAHVLGTLDDKIDLNRRMNETLETMARALFKSWFVNFDPVRAKIEGSWRRGESLPGLPDDLYDLFPDRLVDSELGEIPEGWEVKSLRELIDVERGLSYKGSGLSSCGVPMHNLNSIYEGGGYKDEGIKYYSGAYRVRHVTRPGDVLVANTEQGHDRLLIGYAAIVPTRFGDEGLFSHHIYRVRPKRSAPFTPDFICQLLNTRTMQGTVSGYATGTTVNMLPLDALKIPSTVVPHNQLVEAFSTIVEATRTRQTEIVEESQSLAAQRDALLPKLLTGKVRIESVT